MSHITVASSSSSLFSESSAASSSSSSASPLRRVSKDPRPLKQKDKSSSIHLPFQLPTPTVSNYVDLNSLELDGDYENRPIGFILSHLRSLGPSLLTSCIRTNIHLPMIPELPSSLPVQFPPMPPKCLQFPPTHILALSSPDVERTLLMPVHGLLWAAASPALSCLSSRGRMNWEEGMLPVDMLPVCELPVPSMKAIQILQAWVYLRSSNILLSALLPPSPNSNSLSNLLNPSSSTLSHQLSVLPRSVLLEKVEMIHSLWELTVALEIGVGEEGLWNGMRVAWEVLIGALAVREANSRKEQASKK